jgi:hypothetical protein
LKKKLPTADNGWSSSLGFGRGITIPVREKPACCEMLQKASHLTSRGHLTKSSSFGFRRGANSSLPWKENSLLRNVTVGPGVGRIFWNDLGNRKCIWDLKHEVSGISAKFTVNSSKGITKG